MDVLRADTYMAWTRNGMNRGFRYNIYLLLYFLWEIDCAAQSIINFICRPILFVLHLTLKLFGQKVTWEERRAQIDKILKVAPLSTSNKTFGGLIGLLELAVLNFAQAITGVQLYSFVFESAVGLILLIVVVAVVGIFLHSLLIDDKKIPSYFNRFNKELKGRKWKYRLKCAIVLLIIITIVVCSFVALAYSC